MRKCNQMPYHIGLVLKLHLSRQGKHIVAVNDGASRAVYNRLVVSGNEKYRLRKTADLVPMDRARLDFLETSYRTEAGIKKGNTKEKRDAQKNTERMETFGNRSRFASGGPYDGGFPRQSRCHDIRIGRCSI